MKQTANPLPLHWLYHIVYSFVKYCRYFHID